MAGLTPTMADPTSTRLPPILVFDAVAGEYRDPSDAADTTARADAPTRTVLVTGASGLLGRQVQRQFARSGWKAIGTGLTRTSPPDIVALNILNRKHIDALLDDVKPDVVVHCAANRFPDSCSANPAAAHSLNVQASRALAEAAVARGMFLLYVSTDYVFPGRRGEAPYQPASVPDPPNVYGRTKLEGERAVLDVAASAPAANAAVVLRVPVLYGSCDEPRESAVNVLMSQLWAAQKLDAPAPAVAVDDWALRFPTNTDDVGRVCRDIADLYRSPDNAATDLPPILHFSSEDRMTKWQMVQTFADITGLPLDKLAPSRPDDEPGQDTTRPYDCHLDTSALRELGVNVSTVGFRDWWSKELGAFR
ncbi:NAD(P)-binding protein [Didymella exigua CBS 183.55]|uniref:NAD(P)-binding protein n=1 Tax=Didymella exigua CBS 183.55 TaxID=1150837 RepID=A0A6A5RIT7_9PLEO|nr:NAD(P)-binding protein [Didymella exigua CBS 183.55]KAF1928281.1 NAD(P)-binding protein [Didymella exigua CBS 183.55]